MIIIEGIQLLLLFFCCSYVSLTDLKYGKIENKMIGIAGVIGITLDVFYYGLCDNDLFKDFLFNILFVTAISIALYMMHIWAGGDCKLLILIAMLFPARYYWMVNSSRFTFWFMIMITFFVGYLFVIGDTTILLYYDCKKLNRKIIIMQFTSALWRYAKSIIYLMVLSHIYTYFVVPIFTVPRVIYTCICILFIWIISVSKLFTSKSLLITVIIFDIVMSCFTGYIPLSLEWKNYLLVILFMLMKVFIERYNYQNINVDKLKEGMILSKASSLWMQNSKVKGLPMVSDETLKSRLKQVEVASIVRWKSSKYGMEQVTVVRKIPFAIFMSLGVLLYVIIGGFIL